MWLPGAAGAAVLFASIAVPLHRRFDIGGLALWSFLTFVALAALALVLGDRDPNVLVGPALTSAAGAVAASAYAVRRLQRGLTIPDPLPEIAGGAAAFLGGAAAGFVLGLPLALFGGPPIG